MSSSHRANDDRLIFWKLKRFVEQYFYYSKVLRRTCTYTLWLVKMSSHHIFTGNYSSAAAGAYNFHEITPIAKIPSDPNSSQRWLHFLLIMFGRAVSRFEVTGKRKSEVHSFTVLCLPRCGRNLKKKLSRESISWPRAFLPRLVTPLPLCLCIDIV